MIFFTIALIKAIGRQARTGTNENKQLFMQMQKLYKRDFYFIFYVRADFF